MARNLGPSVSTVGLKEFHRDLKKIDRNLSKKLDKELLAIGVVVQDEARGLFEGYDTRTATGFRARMDGFGAVAVKQTRRRTTGKRPDFGALQMTKALLPARQDHAEDTERRLEDVLERVVADAGFWAQ